MGEEEKSILSRMKLWVSKTSENKAVRYTYSFVIGAVTAGGIIGVCTFASFAVVPIAILASIGFALSSYFTNKGINNMLEARKTSERVPLLEKEIEGLKMVIELQHENLELQKRRSSSYAKMGHIFAKHLTDDKDRQTVLKLLNDIEPEHESSDSIHRYTDNGESLESEPADVKAIEWEELNKVAILQAQLQPDHKHTPAASKQLTETPYHSSTITTLQSFQSAAATASTTNPPNPVATPAPQLNHHITAAASSTSASSAAQPDVKQTLLTSVARSHPSDLTNVKSNSIQPSKAKPAQPPWVTYHSTEGDDEREGYQKPNNKDDGNEMTPLFTR